MTEQTIGPCPVCGVGEFYEHSDYRWCNACGFCAPFETWSRLSGQAARIAALEAELTPLRELWAAVEGLERRVIYFECMPDVGGWVVSARRNSGLGDTVAAALIRLAKEVQSE